MTEFRPGRFEILPIIIKNLLIINGLFFLAQKTLAPIVDMESLLGLHHVKSPLFQPWQLVTYLFLHGDLGHLFANMFALWMFGSILENLWGPKRFLTFYFLCGIGAGLIQLVSLWYQYHDLISQFLVIKDHPTNSNIISFFQSYEPEAVEPVRNYLAAGGNFAPAVERISSIAYKILGNPTIGASGAVFGILAAFVYLFPNTYIYLYFLVPIKAKWIGLGYFAFEMISAIANGPTDNVAHWAHLGGGLVGFLLVLTWNKKNRSNFY